MKSVCTTATATAAVAAAATACAALLTLASPGPANEARAFAADANLARPARCQTGPMAWSVVVSSLFAAGA
jgi:hypothetical protein